MYTKVKKAQETGVRYPVTVGSTTDKAYGEHADDFMGHIALQGKSKVNTLIDSWDDVEEELKDAIWEDVQVFYDLFASIYDHLFFV